MKELNNPAARLHAFLQKAKQNTEYAGTLSTEVWPKLLNVPKEDQALMFKRFGGVMELPLLIKERIENLPNINHELQLRWMSKVNQAFQANNFSAAFASFIGKIDDSTLLGIEHCADILSRLDADPEIKPIDQNTARFFNRVAVDMGYGGMANTDDEGDRIASLMGNKSVMMMGNHGVLICASTVAEAFDLTYYLERSCRNLVLAYQTGQKLHVMSNSVAEKTAQEWEADRDQFHSHFAEMKLILDGIDSSYKN